ncbi:hypothetical protein BS78_03G167700 [Paspalum vaginatum]|nr:hypothetical protein BS78_03G167700 [Paspalum vaginatum]
MRLGEKAFADKTLIMLVETPMNPSLLDMIQIYMVLTARNPIEASTCVNTWSCYI